VAEHQDRRATYRLSPPGPVGFLSGPSRLARCGGTLVGERVDDRVAVWLVHEDRRRTALMLPGEYSARVDPLELLDEHGHTIASGGDEIVVVGGFLPGDDARAVGYEQGVFCAGRVLRAATLGSMSGWSDRGRDPRAFGA
jgi:hypothetical protein